MQLNEAFIVSSVRTAVGKGKKGALKDIRPEWMGAQAVKTAVERVKNLEPGQIDDVLIGCAFPEGPQGMNYGRVIVQMAGLPDEVPGATINRFCSSGLQTISMATQQIMVGQNDVVVAGGAESMSMVPMGGYFFAPDPEFALERPGAYTNMGNTAENVADMFDVSREDQDAFALRSHERALAAIDEGRFEEEIFPLELEEFVYEGGKAVEVKKTFKVDEGPRRGSTLAALAMLRPVFRTGGSVTAGNSSQVSDGAAAAVVMSKRVMMDLGVEPMARLVGYAVAGVPPEIMGIGPKAAIPKALKQVGLTVNDIGLVELNEAFASQAIASVRGVGIDPEIVNVNGGAIALGHPLGCTGAKLTATLLHEMKRRKVRYGIVSMCIGGGMGAAGVFENLML